MLMVIQEKVLFKLLQINKFKFKINTISKKNNLALFHKAIEPRVKTWSQIKFKMIVCQKNNY